MPSNNSQQEKILVIKLGALGDFIQALGPMAAIRAHHPKANITLLTTKPFEKLATNSNYFDAIWLDEKPKFFHFKKWISFKNKLNAAHISRVYDLQNNVCMGEDILTGKLLTALTSNTQWSSVVFLI
jgi:ADP-heptose:LPS heptosyltransferase